jgi:hypothetical protein
MDTPEKRVREKSSRDFVKPTPATQPLPGSYSASTASPSPTSLFYTDPYSEDGEEDDLELLPEDSGPFAQQQRREEGAEEGGTSICDGRTTILIYKVALPAGL